MLIRIYCVQGEDIKIVSTASSDWRQGWTLKGENDPHNADIAADILLDL